MDKEQIRALRLKFGLSQAQMAARLDVPFRTFQNWESGTVPNGHAMLKLARLADEADRVELESPPEAEGFDARRKVGIGYDWIARNIERVKDSPLLKSFVKGKTTP